MCFSRKRKEVINIATVITSVPNSERKFPAEKDGLKRFRVEGLVYAKSKTDAVETVKSGTLAAALVSK